MNRRAFQTPEELGRPFASFDAWNAGRSTTGRVRDEARITGSAADLVTMLGMPRRSMALQEADADARRIRFEIGREIRNARVDGGLSLRTAAAQVEMSHAQLGRLEQGRVERPTVEQLNRACSAVGLKLLVRAIPGTGLALDAGQLALIGRLRAQLPPSVRVRTEVPLPFPGDRRAWDAVLDLTPDDLPVEAETRMRDLQAIDRRCGLKLRDSPFDRMVLLVADTANNRRMLEQYREQLRASFPLDTRAALRALRAGRTPETSAIVIL